MCRNGNAKKALSNQVGKCKTHMHTHSHTLTNQIGTFNIFVLSDKQTLSFSAFNTFLPFASVLN